MGKRNFSDQPLKIHTPQWLSGSRWQDSLGVGKGSTSQRRSPVSPQLLKAPGETDLPVGVQKLFFFT